MSNELTLFDYGTLPVNDAMELSAIKERIRIRLKRTAEDIIEIGLDLIEAKRIAGHGGFEKWLKAEFEMSQMSATRFINVANSFGDCKSNTVLDLNAKVLYALSAPSMPDEVRTEIIERVENGESINLAEIQRLKKEAADLKNEKQAILDNLAGANREIEEKQKRVNFLEIDRDGFKKQNDELRNRDQSLIDAKVAEAKAQMILENQQAIAEAKQNAEKAQSELDRLKREQATQIELGVKRELQNFDVEIMKKQQQIDSYSRDIEKLREVENSLEREVGHLQTHKKAIERIKDNLSFLTVSFSDAFDTNTIPSEVLTDWQSISYAISQINKQMIEFIKEKRPLESTAIIGELVN